MIEDIDWGEDGCVEEATNRLNIELEKNERKAKEVFENE